MKIARTALFGFVLLFSVVSTIYGAVLYRDAQARTALSVAVAGTAAREAAEEEKVLSTPAPTRKKLAGTAERVSVPKLKTGTKMAVLKMPHTDGPILIKQGTNNMSRETELLNTGSAVHYTDSAKWFDSGVFAMSGHRTTYGAVFGNLDRMEKGDTATITTKDGTYRYTYVTTKIVSPSDVWIITPAKRIKSLAHGGLVMSACHPKHSARQRIVVFWRFEGYASRHL